MTDPRIQPHKAELEAIASGDHKQQTKRDRPGATIELATPELWPEPITNGASVADAVMAAIRRHVAMSSRQRPR